ncbi:hypothetical protein N7537_003818 [Penicillium hordei]|uniref:Zn(2)-C6 fungal-type domain-containing protein n=1 Tax=Penicillium hordei TaxID=40994 RepID=A0AAD6H386_9EURO|nr:uncharacterized protein N7537_003818 [Penicillium hordei]KAJ5607199.1 hypothetical protein N7537_003818 [Penicillium hordei]
MNPDETGTSSPRDDLDMTNNETPASQVQKWHDRPPSTLKSLSAVSEASSDPLTESFVPQPLIEKIAIPRGSNSGLWTSNGRVSRACDTCREQKVKCSGHRPACQRCREGDFTCVYTDRKREREVKFSGPVSQKYLMHEWLIPIFRQSADLMSQVRMYEDLLRNLHPCLERQLAIKIEKAIGVLPGASSTTPDGHQAKSNPIRPTDHMVEDLNRNRNTQAAGLVGRPSEVAWLHSLQCEMDKHSKPECPLDKSEQPPLLSTNYFLDNFPMSMAYLNNLADWPSEDAASELVESYFQIVHASYPFVGKLYFWKQFRAFYANPGKQPGGAWIAVLNLVLAIASRHNSLMRKEPETDTDVHISYFTRAWQLYMRNSAVLDPPNLQQVQIESLMSLYMLSIGDINRYVYSNAASKNRGLMMSRAWRICGVAMRSAVAMGIHLRSKSESISYISNEMRYRLWWALYSLDIQLCSMTGRPPNMSLEYCTAFLPAPYQEEDFLEDHVSQFISDDDTRKALLASFIFRAFKSDRKGEHAEHLHHPAMSDNDSPIALAPNSVKPNTSLYFLFRLGLAFVGRAAMDEIHSPSTASLSWDELEASIIRNNASADNWLANLPFVYHFEKSSPNRPFVRQRTSLAFQFYSIKLVILEPCLRRAIRVPFEGSCSKHCQIMATLCMQVAESVLNLFPDKADIRWLYGYCPWWSIVHYLMQSSAILLIGLAGQIDLGAIQNAATVNNIRKACGWLYEMSKNDRFSKRAWGVYRGLAARHNPNLVPLSTLNT